MIVHVLAQFMFVIGHASQVTQLGQLAALGLSKVLLLIYSSIIVKPCPYCQRVGGLQRVRAAQRA